MAVVEIVQHLEHYDEVSYKYTFIIMIMSLGNNDIQTILVGIGRGEATEVCLYLIQK